MSINKNLIKDKSRIIRGNIRVQTNNGDWLDKIMAEG